MKCFFGIQEYFLSKKYDLQLVKDPFLNSMGSSFNPVPKSNN